MYKKYTIILTVFFAIVTIVFFYTNKISGSNIENSSLKDAKVIDCGKVRHEIQRHDDSKESDRHTDYDYKVTWYQDITVEYSVSDKPYKNKKSIKLLSRTYDERPHNISDSDVSLRYKNGDVFQVYVSRDDKDKFWLKNELERNAEISKTFHNICLAITLILVGVDIILIVKKK